METIGVFGGTFDPPHIGHLILAAEARAQLALDRLLWVLTPNPPHKQNRTITPLQHRLAMVKLVLEDATEFELSTVDLDRPAPHYALDTVKILADQNPGAQLVYLMGGDSLRDLPTWHHPADFVKACQHIGVMRRPGAEFDLAGIAELFPGLSEKIVSIDAPLVDISAKEIRLRVTENRPFRYFLPPRVYAYLLENNLYRSE
jgi:nicotinate-nucleotide adenylyltransferase